MNELLEILEATKIHIRGALAFADDAMRRANDAMELPAGKNVDAAYLTKQLEFIIQYTKLAKRLVADCPELLDDLAAEDSPANHDASAAE